MYDLLTNPIRQWALRPRSTSYNDRTSLSLSHLPESSILPPCSPSSPTTSQSTSSRVSGRPRASSSPLSPSISSASVDLNKISFDPSLKQLQARPKLVSLVQKPDECSPGFPPCSTSGMEDDVKAAFGSDIEFDFKWEPTSVLVPSLDQELQKCDALAGGELKFDFYRKTPLIDDDSQRSTSDEISSSGHPHPPPSVSTSQLNAVMQDENIKDSSYSLKTPPHPRFTVFNSQITPSREKPSSVGSRSPSPSRPRADLDVPYLSSRTSSPLVLSPFTTPLKDHNVKCSGWTNCKPCTEVVDVNDVNAQSALATLYPEDRDEPIERFCSGHRNTILMESGFLSRKVKDKWVEFKGMSMALCMLKWFLVSD
jgi:hypothetical protein